MKERVTDRRVVVGLTSVATIISVIAAFVALGEFGSRLSPASAAPTQTTDTLRESTLLGDDAISPPVETSEESEPPAFRNVVMVLADDLDWKLFDQIPRLAALKEQGMTFTNHTVVDSLCCPSRVTILRSQYIHNHKVVSNIEATGGGWPTFRELGEHRDNLPVWLSRAGVTTALFGKYLNEYPTRPGGIRYVPPGWDEWAVPISRGDSYSGYSYTLNDNGDLVRYGTKPEDFLGDVLNDKARSFIARTSDPFFLYLSTYTPHKPFATAPRHLGAHIGTVAPRTPAYNSFGENEPGWLAEFPQLSDWKLSELDKTWRKRAQSAETVADSVDAVLEELKATGKDGETLVVVTTDNGYHVGEYRVPKGKRTPYATDTVVPLIAIGPGIPAGVEVDAMTSTIDLAPTFTELLGGRAPLWVDGRSLVPFLAAGREPEDWRNAALSESIGETNPSDPDFLPFIPPPFSAIRTPRWMYVEYDDGSRALYDQLTDPYELRNVVDVVDPAFVAALSAQLAQLERCAGPSCREADAITITDPLPVAAS
ncbi:MAG: sulfatase [Candidatus Nanopelagicales bacterium]